jgi:hypothetical protein
LCGENEGVINIALDAPGEAFFNSLKRDMKRMRWELNRDSDYVLFALRKDGSGKSFVVILVEDRVAINWMRAVDWINEVNEIPPNKIYAIIENDDG